MWINLKKLWGDEKCKSNSELLLTKPSTGQDCLANETVETDVFNSHFTNTASKIQSSIIPLTREEKTLLESTTPNTNVSHQDGIFTFHDVSYEDL